VAARGFTQTFAAFNAGKRGNMANLANKVKVTIKVADPVPTPPDTVILEMPRDVAQGLINALSNISTASTVGGHCFEVFSGLSGAGFYPKHSEARVKGLSPGLKLVEFES
jgi:hypothetical protein